jgi:hypothetical protein
MMNTIAPAMPVFIDADWPITQRAKKESRDLQPARASPK